MKLQQPITQSLDSLLSQFQEEHLIVQSTNRTNSLLQSAIYALLNEETPNITTIYNELINYENLKIETLNLIESKSKILEYYIYQDVDNETASDKIVAPLLVQILKYYDGKDNQQDNQQRNHNVNQTLSTPKEIKEEPSIQSIKESTLFLNKPKYFHSKTQNQLITEYLNKNKELKKYQHLQNQQDDYERYRQWSITQQQLEDEKKQRLRMEQLDNRQFNNLYGRQTTPKKKQMNKSKSYNHKNNDYSLTIQHLNQQIDQIEFQLNSNQKHKNKKTKIIKILNNQNTQQNNQQNKRLLKSQNSSKNLQNYEQLWIKLKIKIKELNKLKELQNNLDDYQRRREWSIQQRQFMEEQQEKQKRERSSSREIKFGFDRAYSPKLSRANSCRVSLDKQKDYAHKIKMLEDEIHNFEIQLKQITHY